MTTAASYALAFLAGALVGLVPCLLGKLRRWQQRRADQRYYRVQLARVERENRMKRGATGL